jgi:hypothetical protein
MSAQLSNNHPSFRTIGTPAPIRIQIPGLCINDEQVDGEIYIQWTPSANSMRPQTSTVFIIAGPNANRPGLHLHNGLSKSHVQGLTEMQAEAFIPTEQAANTEGILTGGGEEDVRSKQYKKPGPKPGYKRRASVTLITTSQNDASPSAASPSKRRKTVSKSNENGHESTVPPTSTSPYMSKLGVISTLVATHLANSVNTGLGAEEKNSLGEEPLKLSAEEVGQGPVTSLAKSFSKNPEPGKTSEETTTKSYMKELGGKKITVDGMGRKRVRDARGKFVNMNRPSFQLKDSSGHYTNN